MAIIDVVSWDAPQYNDTVYAWRFPGNELSTWTQLLVHESQEAVLYRSGAVDGPFGAGRHVLKTENIPVLKNLLNLPFGRSPFTAEIWYVNKAIPLDVKWGTREPIRLKDPEYKVMIPITAHGQYGIQIEDSRKFLIKLVGAMPSFNQEQMSDYFRGVILTVAKTVIAQEIVKNKIPILEIATQLTELSEAIKSNLKETLDEFGLKLVNFYVSHIDVQEGDPSILKLRDALAKKAEMDIVGYTYQQERSLNAFEGAAGYTAATNGLEGAGVGNAVMGSAIGMGLGVGMGVPMGQSFGQQFTQHAAPAFSAQSTTIICGKCQSPVPPNAKFCPGCGSAAQAIEPLTVSCGGCGVPQPIAAAFCSNCAAPLKAACDSCGVPLAAHAKFCGSCGKPRA